MLWKLVLKVLTLGPGKYAEFSSAPTVDLTMARVELNKRHARDLEPVSSETNGARHNTGALPLLNKCIGGLWLT